MTLVLDDLRQDLRIHLGFEATDTTGLSNARAELLLNRSYWEISDKFPFRAKEKTVTFNFVDGVRRYAMPTPFEYLRFLSREDPTGKDHKKLERRTREWYENNYVNNTDAEGPPEFYFREGLDIIVYPTPEQTYLGTLVYDTIFNDLSDSNITPETERVWGEILLYGAIWRGFDSLQDYQRSAVMIGRQQGLILGQATVEEKEEDDSTLAGVELPEELTTI